MTAPRLGGPFKYRPAVATDIRKTFARIRRELAEQAAQPPRPTAARLERARFHRALRAASSVRSQVHEDRACLRGCV
jgi:hypothetical protein